MQNHALSIGGSFHFIHGARNMHSIPSVIISGALDFAPTMSDIILPQYFTPGEQMTRNNLLRP